MTNTYDGDGRLTKQFEAVGTDHWDAYFVRSTVLRGEVILWTEVATNPVYAPGWSNTVRYASVYANGDRIAQVYSGLTYEGNVTFEFPEPLTGRRRGIEPDPLGQEEGSYDPGEGSGDVGSYPEPREFGNVEDMNLGCTLDGITVDCATASRVMNSGAAAKQYLIHDRQGWHSEQYPIVPIGLGLFVMEKPYFRNVNDNEGPGTVLDTEEVFFKPDPAVIELVKKVLSRPECSAFMKAMLKAAETDENPALEDGDIEKIFDDFLDQNKGGLARDKQPGSPYGTVRGRIGSNGDGNGVIYSYATSGDQIRADASTIIGDY